MEENAKPKNCLIPDESKDRLVEFKAYLDDLDKITKDPNDGQKLLLQLALENRKEEIDRYWTRAAYYWAFTAAAIIAYATVYAKTEGETGDIVLTFLSGIGVVLSLAWYLANRGSSYWHANWEEHSELIVKHFLNTDILKIVLDPESGSGLAKWWKPFNAYPKSVTKINAIVSLYFVATWIAVYLFNLNIFNDAKYPSFPRILNLILVIGAVICLFAFTRSSGVPKREKSPKSRRFIRRGDRAA